MADHGRHTQALRLGDEKTSSTGSALGSVASTMGKVNLGVAIAGGLTVGNVADFMSSATILQTSGRKTASQVDQVRKCKINRYSVET